MRHTKINPYKEKRTMNNNLNNLNTNQDTSMKTNSLNSLNSNQDITMNSNLLNSNQDITMRQNTMNANTPVIANDSLMDIITIDDIFIGAARTVKNNAFNPSGSEHGIVKKACDMIIDNPSFRENIRQNLLKGTYYPEGIVFDPLFEEKNMVLPRGFKYTMNQIVQNMIMAVVEASGIYEYALPHAWSEMHCPGIRNMFTTIDRIRAKGYKYWFVLKQNSFLARIPHDRLVQKIQIMFQDERVADVVCALMGLNVPEADEHNKAKYFGIPKDNPLTDLLAYGLYLRELDQEIMRLGLEFVRFNEEYVVFCDSYAHAKHAQSMLWAFARDTMGCPVNRNYSQIKDIAHLAFRGLRLWRGKWRIQEQLKKNAEDGYLARLAGSVSNMDRSELWKAYSLLTRFISCFEGVDDVKDEVLSMKKMRDELFINAITLAEKVKLGLVKLPE